MLLNLIKKLKNYRKDQKSIFFIIFIIPIIGIFLSFTNTSYSQSIDVIKTNIDSHGDKIRQLEQEIQNYSKQMEVVSGQAKTLQNAVQVIVLNQKKISAEIKKTETNIQKTNETISSLGLQIGDTEEKISSNSDAIAKALNSMRQRDDVSMIETLLTNKSISEFLNEYESVSQFQQKVREQSKELSYHKEELGNKKTDTEKEKSKLVALKSQLSDQNKILEISRKEQADLLKATQNKESEYRNLLASKQAEKERFEKELFEFESALKRAVDPGSYPSPRKGILSWPLDNIFITQPFGKTVDSKRLYVSGTHNGVDFRASRGTKVMSVLDGIVEGTGNTDEQRGCYSYGKWILIKHPNGLTSLYAHLDLIKVSAGERVSTGDIIGYSGQTGYSTGPHLHLTLLASQGVEIQRYSSSRNCKNVSIPIADTKSYLDPMLYF